MVSSIFYGHNKRTAEQEDVLWLLSCTWGEERILPRTSAPRGGGELQSRDSTATCKKSWYGLVLHLPDQQSWNCLPPLTQARSVPAPLPITPHLAASVGCYVQHLLYRMRLIQNRKNRLRQEAQSTAQPPAALRKCNPSFILQKLFASVLLDSHFSTNSINSCMGLLHILFAFQPG